MELLTIAAALLWLISGGLWLKGATVPIRNNLDEIVGDLQRAAYWNGRAAITACAAAGASAIVALGEVLR